MGDNALRTSRNHGNSLLGLSVLLLVPTLLPSAEGQITLDAARPGARTLMDAQPGNTRCCFTFPGVQVYALANLLACALKT